jgi:hypothetical protein
MGDFTLRVLTRVRRAGKSADSTRRPISPMRCSNDSLTAYEQVTGSLECDGEAAAVGIGPRPGLRRFNHRPPKELVEREQGPHLLLDADRIARAQDTSGPARCTSPSVGEAKARLDEAGRALRDDQRITLDLPGTNVPAGRTLFLGQQMQAHHHDLPRPRYCA